MKKVCVRILVCLVIGTMLTGQGLAQEPLQPMTIQLNWVTNVEFAGILLAKERGWYKEAGIDLTVKEWKAGLSAVDEVLSGNAQICVAEGAEIIEKRAKEKKIRAFAAQFQKSPHCLLSKKEQGIGTPEKLKGKKIGITASPAQLMVKIVLSDAGLKYEDIIPVNVGWDIQPLLDDKIDAYPAYMNNEPLIMKEKGYATNVIPAFKYGYDFYSEVYSASDDILRKHPELIRKFTDVSYRGWREAFKDVPGTARMIVEKYYPQGSVKQQTESLKVFKYLATMGVGESLIGFMEEQIWNESIGILYKFGQIEKKIPATDVFTLEFLKK